MQGYPQQTRAEQPQTSTYMQQLIEQMEIQLKRLYDLESRLRAVGNRCRSDEPGQNPTKSGGVSELAPGYLSTLANNIEVLRNRNNDLEETTCKLEQAF